MYLYLKSRRFKQVIFTASFSTLQAKNHPDIVISFNGQEIKNLSKLLVLCWNGGTEEIRSSDMPSAESPTIVFPEHIRLLSYKLVEESSPGLNFLLEKRNDQILSFKFEYLNPQDGGLIELLYENRGSDDFDVDLNVQIIGGRPKLEKEYETKRGTAALWLLGVFSVMAFCVGVFTLVIALGTQPVDWLLLILGIISLLDLMLLSYLFLQAFKLYRSALIPTFAVKYFEGKL